MNHTLVAVASAVAFVWLGMVVALSFIEAPLKFRAPGVTIVIGLGIGRIVFRALNTVEAALATALVVLVGVGNPSAPALVLAVVIVIILVVQLGVIRPRLNRRSDRVLAGERLPRSRGHLVYVGLESVKVVALIAFGATVLSS